jgi:hypothetical protein
MVKDTFVFRNSIVYNGGAGVFAATIFAALESRVVELGQAKIFALLVLGFLSAWFFYRTFDRRIKVLINSEGVFDRRNSNMQIAWADVSRFSLTRNRGGPILTLHFKEADPWLKTARSTGVWVSKFFDVKDFFTQIPLETMPYDEAILRAFILQKIST